MCTLNILGVIHGVEAVLPTMQRQKSGTIINISSLADRRARPQMAVYAATKAAVKSLSESLQMAHAKDGIRVCNIAPAKIMTPLSLAMTRSAQDDAMIQVDDFSKIVLWVYEQPKMICIRDMVVAPTGYEK
jgi:NADP-dependent 3-hydroxy acid dehydrogenase YdfG